VPYRDIREGATRVGAGGGLTENAGHEIAGNEIARHGKYRDKA